jgi:hypothetical protein
MKHLILYESYSTSEVDLPNEIRLQYLQELGKHVTYPDIFAKDIYAWQGIVNDNDPPEKRIPGLPYSLHQLLNMAELNVINTWGTPQGAFDNFVGFVCDVGGDESEWDELKNHTIKDYMQMSGKSKEIAALMKAVYDGYQIIEWIDAKK